MPGTRKTGPNDIALAEKQRTALELRKAGLTFEQIAQQVGFNSRQAAFDNVMRAIKEIKREPAEELDSLELARLDTLLTRVWPKALQGDHKAIDTELKLMERRARMMGIDAPVKHEPMQLDINVNKRLEEYSDEEMAMLMAWWMRRRQAEQGHGKMLPEGKRQA